MWYSRVVANLGSIPDFIAHYERELEEAKRECRIGGYVEHNIKELPGITEHRFNQLQEIEAILNFLNIQLRKIRRRHFQKYLEAYARQLTSRDAFNQRNQEAADVQLRTLRPLPSSTSNPPKPKLTMQRPPTLWDRMSAETRASIESYEHPRSREFCVEFLTTNYFYTQCTFNEIQMLLIVLGKERTLSNFQNLFN